MIQEHHFETVRTARYYLHGEIGPQVTDVWFACHGYGQLGSDFVKEFDCIAAPHRLIVVPESTSRFYLTASTGFHGPDTKIGATWMTREDRETDIADYVAYLDRVADYIKARVSQKCRLHALGFSQGSSTAFRWAVQGNTRIDRLILWAGEVPSDVDMQQAAVKLAQTNITLVTGASDKLMPPHIMQIQQKRLDAAGIPYTTEQHAGAHEMNTDLLQRLASI